MDYKKLTILCVEDSKILMKTYKELLSMIFKKVYTAKNGKEGFEAFKKYKPDIILTDEIMPEMNGLEMIREIRKIDKDIPIILVSAFDDKKLLTTAIDNNITAFVKKPITKKKLFDAFEKASKYALINKKLFLNLKQTIDYKNYQEKLALEKEKKIIRVEKVTIDSFEISHLYHPLDITSGDSFSIRKKCIFLVDAMGKGVAASITAMLATAFFNYLINKDFEFKEVLKEFIFFMKDNLLDYEVLSFGIYKIEKDKMCFSAFSMPTIILQRDDKIEKIRCNNPPLSIANEKINFSDIDLTNVKKMLIFSDGLIESMTKDGRIYLQHLKEDFLTSENLEEFEKKRKSRIIKEEDDVTYFFLKKLP